MGLPFSFDDFRAAIPGACASETAAAGGRGWTPENPTWGHCAVVALWVQNFFGGDLLRTSLEGTPFAEARSHYLNGSPGGSVIDLTKEQFGGHLFKFWQPEERTRAYVIGGADTRERYARFGLRLLQILFPNREILQKDASYQECLYQALLSPCQKKGVGAVLDDGQSRLFLADHNETIPELESFCQPTCIRLSIPSRTESMLGACGHAEERLIFKALKTTPTLKRYYLKVAAVTSQGLPEERSTREFTCLRCAVAMKHAGVAGVFVAYKGLGWSFQTTTEALLSAKAYALGEKKV